MWRCGLREVRYVLTAGGIIALHVGVVSSVMSAGAVQAVVELGGEPVARLLERIEQRMVELAVRPRRAAGAPRRRDDRRRGQAAAAAARLPGRGRAAAGDRRARPSAAVAVELVHGATLVHDDVLDGSPLRRGRPTVFAAGGRAMATATGDLLFSRAFAELAGDRTRSRRSGSCPGPAASSPRGS